MRDPFGSLLRAAERFGDPYTWPTFLGKVVITGAPEGIKTLLSADPEIYEALGADLLGPVIGRNNLILLSGERHRAMRKMQNPQFHGARLRAYGRIITSVAEAHIGQWPKERPFPIQETMQAISLEVILQAVLGLGDPTSRAVFKDAVLSAIAALKPSFMFFPALRRPMLGWSAWARFGRQKAVTTALFNKELAARRARSDVGEDILSLMIASRKEDGSVFDDDELLEQMMSLIGAGHETTASALTWALYHIHRDPRVKARLLEELSGNAAAERPRGGHAAALSGRGLLGDAAPQPGRSPGRSHAAPGPDARGVRPACGGVGGDRDRQCSPAPRALSGA